MHHSSPNGHRSDDEDDHRAVNPANSMLLRSAVGPSAAHPHGVRRTSLQPGHGDGGDDVFGHDASAAISANFAASQRRVQLFNPSMGYNGNRSADSINRSPSGTPEPSASRVHNQHVLEQLKAAEAQRRENGSSHQTGETAAGGSGGIGEEAESVEGDDSENGDGLLWGEYYTYNLVDNAFWCISPASKFRRSLFFLIDHPWFERLILTLITLNIITMILDTPVIRDQPVMSTIVLVADIVFQALFTIEMIVKMLALGVLLHRYSYLRSPWNAADFLIVIFGFVAYFLDSQWRTLRIVRVFRLLKALGRVKQLHSISVALTNSAGRMGDVTLLMIFVTCTMAVLGLQLFVGSFQRRCFFMVDEPVYDPFVAFPNGSMNPALSVLTNRTWQRPVLDPLDNSLCGDSGGHTCAHGAVCETHLDVYHERFLSFDHFGFAIFYVLKLITMDNWPSDNVFMQQAEGFFYFIYTFSVVIFGSFFCLNLILAILSGEYEAVVQEENDTADEAAGPATTADVAVLGGGDGEMEEDELQDLDSDVGSEGAAVGAGDYGGAPGADYSAVEGGERSGADPEQQSIVQMLRGYAKRFIANPWFSRIILAVTTINVVALGCDHHPIDPTFDRVLDNINFTCSIIFIVEACIKIFALLAKYFYDGFNIFDFLLCVVSIPEMILSSGGSTFSALRAFRLARVVRVLNNSKTMRQLLITVVDAARGSSFLFLFLGLFLLTASIFAVNFLTDSIPSTERPNFTTLGDAVLALFIVVTGENWVSIAVSSIAGSTWATAIFFYAYYSIGNFLLLNFVVVILITSFNQAAERLRAEEQAELERLRLQEAREERLLKAQGEFLEETQEGAVRAQEGEELRFVDLSSDGPKTTGRTDRPSTGDSEGALSPGISGQYSDGGEVAVKTTSTSFRRIHGDADTRSSEKPKLKRKSSTVSAKAGGITSGMNTPRGVPLPPEPKVDVLDLRHRTFPLEDFFHSITAAVRESAMSDDDIREKMVGNSFKVFSPESGFRFAVAKLVSHPVFELVVTLVILESCIALGFENPESREDPNIVQFLDINAFVLVGLFALEALLRAIAWGAFWGEGTYLSDNWNRIDFFVFLVSIVAIFFPESASLRSLRVFRLAAKVSALRTVIAAVVYAVPGIANVALLILFSFIVFGILGVQLFKGKFVSCTDDTIETRAECFGFYQEEIQGYAIVNGSAVLQSTFNWRRRLWQHDYFNFNHLGIAILTLIQQMFSDGWSNVLYSAMDSRSYDEAKQTNASPENAIFFVIFIIVGNFFLINLFVGSLVDSFSHERNVSDGKIDEDGNPLLTDDQDRWIRTFRVMDATALLPYISRAGNPFRALCQWVYFADDDRLSPSLKFEWFITGAIILNALLMCTTHSEQPDWWTDTLWWSNLGFACLFTVEAIVKISALLPMAYFADSWNRFDFLMVPTAFISLFLGGPGTNAIRVLRVARVLRLVKRAKGLKRLFDSLLYALPQLANISMLLLLTLFVFGVVGTAFFAEVLIDPQSDYPLSENFNFKNALNSMVLLFQISTTESWPDVMQACMINEENSRCSNALGNCGTWVSIPYFLLFMMVANSVALNLFIFVIVDNYMEVNSMNNEHDQLLFFRLSLFRTNWTVLDREGQQRLRWDQFVLLLRRILRASPGSGDDHSGGGPVTLTAEQIAAMKEAIADEEQGERELDAGERVVSSLATANPTGSTLNAHSMQEIAVKSSVVQFMLAKREASFLRMLHRMDIPLDADGNVRYGDCVYAITKEHHGLERDAERQASRFLGLTRDRDPASFFDAFKVHHALAVRKIMRLMRLRQKEAALQRRVKAMFKPMGSLADNGGDDLVDADNEGSSATSFSRSEQGGELQGGNNSSAHMPAEASGQRGEDDEYSDPPLPGSVQHHQNQPASPGGVSRQHSSDAHSEASSRVSRNVSPADGPNSPMKKPGSR